MNATAEALEPDDAGVASQPDPVWSPAKRVAFRFVFVLVVLVNFPFPLNVIPYLDAVNELTLAFWGSVVAWTGEHVLRLADPVTLPPVDTGSGDTRFAYVQLFCIVAISILATAAWTVRDRERVSYVRLDRWLRVYVRFALAAAMLGYGAYKIVPAQFPAPTLGRLMQPFGNASPMGLLWTFMGASAAYSIFAGSVEFLGGLLLAIRRTALLGAIVSAGAMTNVVALNFCYDVPVKLYSSQLLLMAVFLIAPDMARLAGLLVLDRPVEAVVRPPLFEGRRARFAARALALGFVALIAITSFAQAYGGYVGYGTAAPKSPLYGVWEVDEYEVDGVARPPLTTDASRWRRVAFDRPGSAAVQSMDDTVENYTLALDPEASTLAITTRGEAKRTSTFAFERPEPNRLVLDGSFDDHRVRATLRLAERGDVRLTTRGFHWINEYPFNR